MSQARFTDIFVKRPVLSSVISLLIFLMGLAGISSMPLQQYPTMQNTTIIITTVYPGASEDVVQGFITTPLEASIGSADGIDYMTAQSTLGMSTITCYIRLNYDPNTAMTDITGKVNAVLNQLPKQAFSPTIQKQTDQTIPSLILGFTSDSMSPEQITAYVNNIFIPKVNALGGISNVMIYGQMTYAMRIWLDSYKMAKLGITASDVNDALQLNNVQATAGQMKSPYLYIPLDAQTDLHTAQQFDNLVIKNNNGNIIRISDIGHAEMGSENYDTEVSYDGKTAVFAGIQVAPEANPLTVVGAVMKDLPNIALSLPTGLKMSVVYNNTLFIKASIVEVIQTILESTLIVIAVIFLFLGALRAVFIPMITVPLSLVGVCSLMLLMGFSINLLTLLAMVLAIGLVVDDAIVVLENIYRHLEAGSTPFDAALEGAREIANPVIVMTTTLAAVFAPIGFLGGMTGALFREFAFTLAGSVIISGIIALTLSPMLCSKIIDQKVLHGHFAEKIDRMFLKVQGFYKRRLVAVLEYRSIGLLIAVVVLCSCVLFFMLTPQELAPMEDQGFIAVMGSGPTPVNLHYVDQYNQAITNAMMSFPEAANSFVVDGTPTANQVFAGVIFTPWGDRKRTTMQMNPLLQNKLNNITGLQLFSFQFPPLPGSSGLPVQFVIDSVESHDNIFPYSQEIIAKAYQTGDFMFLNSDLRYDQPESVVTIDRDKAAELGVNMSDIANTLSIMLSDNLTNYFDNDGYSYEVVPQVEDSLRQRTQQLNEFYVRSSNNQMLPLSTFVSYSSQVEPSTLNQFQQLNSITIQGMLMPGTTLGTALSDLQTISKQILPPDMNVDYAQQSRQFIQTGNSMLIAFAFAIIVIFLVLAAQFESYRDPAIVLISVPMSICGALIPLFLGAAKINIYTEIGLITLIGLISKHGILMTEFANKLQEQGRSVHDAIIEAASVRLRPILMTTFAMVFGVVPLIMATGAGAESRFDVGLVIASGMTIGTCFTLFMVPIMYTYIAKKHKHID